MRSRSFFAMDTLITVAVSADTADADSLITKAKTEILRLESLWSRFDPESEVSRVNDAAGREAIPVSHETAELLRASRDWTELSGGVFDITAFQPCVFSFLKSRLFRDTCNQGNLLRLLVDNDSSMAYLPRKGPKIDLGGIGKGAAADRVGELLLKEGALGVLVNMGGNVLARGCKNGGQAGHSGQHLWRIGIRDPRKGRRNCCGVVEIEEGSVSTSGLYERRLHIWDPRTGRPAKSELASVSVLAPTAAEADALSTAAFVLGKAAGASFISALSHTGGVFISKKGAIDCVGTAEKVFTRVS